MATTTDQEEIYDLRFEVLEDGNVALEQSAGCGESHYVTLHSTQIHYLAERAGLIPPADLRLRIKELEATIRMLAAAAEADGPPWLRAAIASVMASAGFEGEGEQLQTHSQPMAPATTENISSESVVPDLEKGIQNA